MLACWLAGWLAGWLAAGWLAASGNAGWLLYDSGGSVWRAGDHFRDSFWRVGVRLDVHLMCLGGILESFGVTRGIDGDFWGS